MFPKNVCPHLLMPLNPPPLPPKLTQPVIVTDLDPIASIEVK